MNTIENGILIMDSNGIKATDKLEEIFAAQQTLQRRLGIDVSGMSMQERVAYIKDMTLACTDELHEALRETKWKPWAATGYDIPDRDAFVKELVDVQHFVVNLFLVAGVTADELHRLYMGKNKINHERQDSGTYAG